VSGKPVDDFIAAINSHSPSKLEPLMTDDHTFIDAHGNQDPSTKPFVFNFRVRDLDATLKRMKQEGVTVMEKVETSDYGKFGWIVDLEGNKIELWQPLNEEQQFKKK
jgi:predicted enzyme related to lactoylglutathione lyase